jgi:hypothetical protein
MRLVHPVHVPIFLLTSVIQPSPVTVQTPLLPIYTYASLSAILFCSWLVDTCPASTIGKSVCSYALSEMYFYKIRGIGAPNRIWRDIGTNPLIRDCRGNQNEFDP